MDMDIARQDPGADVAFVAGTIPRGVEELIRIADLAVAVADLAPVQLMTAKAVTPPGQEAVLQGAHLPVADPSHTGLRCDPKWENACHLVLHPAGADDGAREGHHTAALGIDGHAVVMRLA